jgi:hypothetical protein
MDSGCRQKRRVTGIAEDAKESWVAIINCQLKGLQTRAPTEQLTE